ncbi:hypothetical protein ACI7RC_03230 [Brevibacillus sp. B_LB10_24]|uniref:tubby C-terminal domain-like protein n=1 Tax=Brevibacillus sp. B_LB10_24 TaxID=3380645 RepID=UPI0038BB4642
MKHYTFTPKQLIHSTSPAEIADEQGQCVGYLQRYYANRLQRAADILLDNWFVHVKVEEAAGSTNVCARQLWTWGRPKWELTIERGGDSDTSDCLLTDKTRIKTHPRFQYDKAGRSYTFAKNLLDRKTYCYRGESSDCFADITYDHPVVKGMRTVTVYEEELHPFEIIACYRLMDLVY